MGRGKRGSTPVEKALAGKGVHEGRHSDPASTVVRVGLPLSQALLDGRLLLPLPHLPRLPGLPWILVHHMRHLIHEALPLPTPPDQTQMPDTECCRFQDTCTALQTADCQISMARGPCQCSDRIFKEYDLTGTKQLLMFGLLQYPCHLQ